MIDEIVKCWIHKFSGKDKSVQAEIITGTNDAPKSVKEEESSVPQQGEGIGYSSGRNLGGKRRFES